MNYKAVIFDLDGVIVHTDKSHYLAWKEIADKKGIYFDEVINNRLRGVSRMESLEIILERYEGKTLSEEEKVAFASEKNESYKRMLMHLTPEDVAPEVLKGLEYIADKGLKMGIASSSQNAKTILTQIGLIDRFDAICDGTMIKNTKPHPEVFAKAAGMLNFDPKDCLAVEDAISGVESAKAAGMKTVAIGDASENKAGDYNIVSFDEICDLI